MTDRLLSWTGVDDPARVDHASVQLGDDWMRAIGSSRSKRFTTSWELDVAEGWQTRALKVTARGFGWSRTLELSRSARGRWSAVADHHGSIDLPEPGLGEPDSLDGATDCDLGLCPVTNTMPIRRLGVLDHDVDDKHLVMAWVEVPSLRVLRSDQVYASAPSDDDGRRVRYASYSGDFSAVLSVDEDGLVVDYPDLARRS
ncbi:putative glycolipid-binding domain-containing protein [uncultured Cellulomonas sp.]|uniref:putative glycolipid-binding domain-containing protein n=1 Tax=uncultured Cellulomonas sp. TaxID=189682 RepID=UPI0026361E19|nr:putative glycolipid-binding domain-containing protein [uncultured Cellulomonas sp.]